MENSGIHSALAQSKVGVGIALVCGVTGITGSVSTVSLVQDTIVIAAKIASKCNLIVKNFFIREGIN